MKSRAVALYYLAAGTAAIVVGGMTTSAWTLIVGAAILGVGLVGTFAGEAGTWLRGEIDERRQRAVDHAFRVAFLALAWWIAVVAAVASETDVSTGAWTAGIAVAIAAAALDYGLVLRRT